MSQRPSVMFLSPWANGFRVPLRRDIGFDATSGCTRKSRHCSIQTDPPPAHQLVSASSHQLRKADGHLRAFDSDHFFPVSQRDCPLHLTIAMYALHLNAE
jgi:hypothetical protein